MRKASWIWFLAGMLATLGVPAQSQQEEAGTSQAGESKTAPAGKPVEAVPDIVAATFREEVSVTATKVETKLMDTGLSVTAYDGNTLRDAGIDDGSDLSVQTAGFSVTDLGRITIRGVGVEVLSLGTDVGVGTYMDGMFTSQISPYQVSNFFDTERIEILRGPQGTLYGRATIGGAVNIVSKKPSDSFDGKVNLELGDFGYKVGQAAVNLPLSKHFIWHLAGSKIDRDGLAKNIHPGSADVENLNNNWFDTTFRGLWTHWWDTDVRFNYYKRDDVPDFNYKIDPHDTKTFAYPFAIWANPTFGYDVPNPTASDRARVDHDFANFRRDSASTVVLTNAFHLGQYDLKYIGGWNNFNDDERGDIDFSGRTEGTGLTNGFRPAYRTQTHELQFISNLKGPVNFLAGAYYYRTAQKLYFDFTDSYNKIYSTSLTPSDPASIPALGIFGVPAFTLGLPGFTGDPLNRLFWFNSQLDAQSRSLFGNASFKLTDRWTVWVGGRYTEDKKQGREFVYLMVPLRQDFTGIPGGIRSDVHDRVGISLGYPLAMTDSSMADDRWTSTDGNLRLEYRPNGKSLLYGYVATGYRPGGFNLGQVAPGVNKFDNEDLTTYEVGYKGRLANGRMNLQTAIYYYDYRNLQILQAFLDPTTGNQGVEITNAAQARTVGGELNGTAYLTNSLSLTLGYVYTDAKYTKFLTADPAVPGSPVVNLAGNRLNRAPENSLSLAANYYLNSPTTGSFQLSAMYSFTDEQFVIPQNLARGRLASWNQIDARVNWKPSRGSWSLALWAKNLGGERQIVDATPGAVSTGFVNYYKLSQPRRIGLRFNYGF